ncbi:unnamed protein product [Trichogramma brassicae]|uniref:WH2 domain-containing protein n=1 Tax=Trichogramma brassicae TaxID=86971 RepID=A0A6H5IY93_9HYME|nr:unnamed protein product [Trichogramma brassicae]
MYTVARKDKPRTRAAQILPIYIAVDRNVGESLLAVSSETSNGTQATEAGKSERHSAKDCLRCAALQLKRICVYVPREERSSSTSTSGVGGVGGNSSNSNSGGGAAAAASSAMVLTVTEDTPADMLAGSMELLVQMPREHSVQTHRVTVQRSTPMMDLLVQIATAHKLAASSYSLQAIGERGLVLTHQPNTPIGALDALQVKLLPKQGTFLSRKKQQSNQPFETTFRLQVHMPRNQLYVSRVSPKTNLGEILDEVCRAKNLDRNKYELRHPANVSDVLNLALSLQDYHLQEVSLCPRNQQSRLGSSVSTQDIMALQRQEEQQQQQQPRQQQQQQANKRHTVFGFVFSRKSKESSLSSDSLGNRSVSPAHSHDETTPRSVSPIIMHHHHHHYHQSNGNGHDVVDKVEKKFQQPLPSRPLRKRRPAPKPPTQQIANQQQQQQQKTAAETESIDKDKIVISHSRNSSDSSGYHEASVLSDNPDNNGSSNNNNNGGRMPNGKMRGILESSSSSSSSSVPRKLAHTSQASKSLCNLAMMASCHTASGGTLSRGISNTSLSSAGQRKKRAAPAPPARPLPSAISVQALERIVDSDESLTSDMELSKPSSDIAGGSDLGTSCGGSHHFVEPARVLGSNNNKDPFPKHRKLTRTLNVDQQRSNLQFSDVDAASCSSPSSFGLPSLTEDEREAIDSIVEAVNVAARLETSSILSSSIDDERRSSDASDEVFIADPAINVDDAVKIRDVEVIIHEEPKLKSSCLSDFQDDTVEPDSTVSPPNTPVGGVLCFGEEAQEDNSGNKKIACAIVSMIPKCAHLNSPIDEDVPPPPPCGFDFAPEKTTSLRKQRARVTRSQSELGHFDIGPAERHGRHLTCHGTESFNFAINPHLGEQARRRIEEEASFAAAVVSNSSKAQQIATDTDILLQKVSDTLSHSYAQPTSQLIHHHNQRHNGHVRHGESINGAVDDSVVRRSKSEDETAPTAPSSVQQQQQQQQQRVEVYELDSAMSRLIFTSTIRVNVCHDPRHACVARRRLSQQLQPQSSCLRVRVRLNNDNDDDLFPAAKRSTSHDYEAAEALQRQQEPQKQQQQQQQDTSDYGGEDLGVSDWDYQIPAPPSEFRDDDQDSITTAGKDSLKDELQPELMKGPEQSIAIEAEVHQRTPSPPLPAPPRPVMPETQSPQIDSTTNDSMSEPAAPSKPPTTTTTTAAATAATAVITEEIKKAEVISELETKITTTKQQGKSISGTSTIMAEKSNEESAPKIAPVENSLSNFTITTYGRQKSLDIFEPVVETAPSSRTISAFATLQRGRSNALDFAEERKKKSNTIGGMKSAQSSIDIVAAAAAPLETKKKESIESIDSASKMIDETVQEKPQQQQQSVTVNRSKSYVSLSSNEKFQNRVDDFEQQSLEDEPREKKQVEMDDSVIDGPTKKIQDVVAASGNAAAAATTTTTTAGCENMSKHERFSQWRENMLKKTEIASSPEAQLQSLQVLKSILPQLKSAQTTGENSVKAVVNEQVQPPTAKPKQEQQQQQQQQPTAEEKNEVQLRTTATATAAAPRRAPSDASAVAAKRYTYCGPPSISLGSWNERPSLNVQIKNDQDYKLNNSNKSAAASSSSSGARTIVNLNGDSTDKPKKPEDDDNESRVDTSSVNFKELTKAFGQEVRLRPKPATAPRPNLVNNQRRSEYIERPKPADSLPKQNGFVSMVGQARPATQPKPVTRYTSVVGITNNSNTNNNNNNYNNNNEEHHHQSTVHLNGQVKTTFKMMNGVKEQANNLSNGVKETVSSTVPKPPTMPIITGVTLKNVNARPKVLRTQSAVDPRDQLLDAIRGFGGRQNLKRLSLDLHLLSYASPATERTRHQNSKFLVCY